MHTTIMTQEYSPGLHLLLTLRVNDVNLLTSLDEFISFSKELIANEDLKIVGISSHSFDTCGFTAAICLMESHICIHTWPEFNQLTLDVYLCNYLKDNSTKVLKIGDAFKAYFEAEVLNETLVNR